MKIKVLSIFGTRPEAIKMAPLIKFLDKDSRFESHVAVTAQHREMLDQVLNFFNIIPDFDLDIMKQGQTLSDITCRVITLLESVYEKIQPDIILVHGDTSTTFAASISAFYHQIPIGHVEAGLRTFDKYSPFPEEMNRQLTDVLSDLYFAPTVNSKNNLINENHAEDKIFITGNTAIDAMRYTISNEYEIPMDVTKGREKLILVTMHRRENIGLPMAKVFSAIKKIAIEYDDIQFIFPMHKNPKVRETAEEILGNLENISLIEPLDVVDFHNYAQKSFLILTDSGGVQEEAPSLGIPVLVLREQTERPEGVNAGTLKLVGTEESTVYDTVLELLKNENIYKKMSTANNPYGDGYASERIADAIYYKFRRGNRPDDFIGLNSSHL
ncbi:UDP-N-acetylglucosamine 2-epimerase (non-hydrolyzing) [Enterococcus hulanensis]|uniref:non-hydrolyzing UDP-N-acetylglucosamine 2-epimerase n=1 Tax=Enterococcus hulanensis TaxID=2559929 RepID=UPI001A92CB4B|nr:UDP-N-acetylglucosamine 2-epimerase (non-hydrolyzing) [Enterococcus hulanensis]MBO0411979.1 UDP-N-acetylglucosamine 2-epimerase (non-hydrolyzing) [Enterococcus hulanensis]